MIVCVSKYRTDRLDFKPGDIIEDPKVIAYVLNDSPASFAPYTVTADADDVTVSAFEQPPESKVVRRGRR